MKSRRPQNLGLIALTALIGGATAALMLTAALNLAVELPISSALQLFLRNQFLTASIETSAEPSSRTLASLAAIAGSAALLTVLGLIWTMTATANRIHRPSEETAGGPDPRTFFKMFVQMHERIRKLEAELAAAKAVNPSFGGGAPNDADTDRRDDLTLDQVISGDGLIDVATAPAAQAEPKPKGKEPGRISEAYFGSTTPPPPPAQPWRPEAQSSPSEPITPAPEPRPLYGSAVQAVRADPNAVSDVMNAYRTAVTSPQAMARFEDRYAPALAALQNERLSFTSDVEAPFWFVGLAGANAAGLLLPSKKIVQYWSELQNMNGIPAKRIFGIAYRVDRGDTLEVIEPAEAVIDGNTLMISAEGYLKGA